MYVRCICLHVYLTNVCLIHELVLLKIKGEITGTNFMKEFQWGWEWDKVQEWERVGFVELLFFLLLFYVCLCDAVV